MVVRKIKFLKLIKNEKGQSIIEFVIFLPFLLMMYTVSMSLANAINGSINQQKVTRSYFYYLLQNNSTFPRPYRDDGAEPYKAWQQFGMQIIGWTEKLVSEDPVMTCYKFKLPLGKKKGDECEKAYRGTTTQFIKIGTVYGVCGATYLNDQKSIHRLPSGGIPSPEAMISTGESCIIK
jgi:hypothetical protein